jgi:hypothetical protein
MGLSPFGIATAHEPSACLHVEIYGDFPKRLLNSHAKTPPDFAARHPISVVTVNNYAVK